MTVSSKSEPRKSPNKFPLTAHKGSGQWCKKIRGRTYYFGKLDRPDDALRRYLAEKDDLEAGRKPRTVDPDANDIDLRQLVNRFLTFKEQLVATGELKRRTWQDYFDCCALLLSATGKHGTVIDLDAEDFAQLRARLAAGVGPTTLSNRIRHIRMVFKFAYDQHLIENTVRYGQSFNMPRKQIRKQARGLAPRMFERHEVLQLVKSADPIMRAMILTGVNCGYGNHDIGQLPIQAVNFETGWIDWPRPKTGEDRRAPLWPETVDALRHACDLCPAPSSEAYAHLFFRTRWGGSWYHDDNCSNPLSQMFKRRLLDPLGLYARGRGFYGLRRTFETIAGDTGDQVAVNLVMGHTDSSMAAVYRQRVADERLVKVVNHVRNWLFLEDTPCDLAE